MAYAFGKLGVRTMLIDAVGGMAAEQMSASPRRRIGTSPSASRPMPARPLRWRSRGGARKVPLVSITDSPFSPFAQIADLWIEVVEANFEGFRSMSATLALAMTLTVAVAERRSKGQK